MESRQHGEPRAASPSSSPDPQYAPHPDSFSEAFSEKLLDLDDYRPDPVEVPELPLDAQTPSSVDMEKNPFADAAPPPSWANMPNKIQLAILALSRFADFFQIACLQAIMFHQLQSFDPKASDSTISWQAGILQGGFTAAQIVSAVIWGRVADSPWAGRKKVLLIGFVGTGFACIGVAFSRSFAQAVAFRIFGGAVNGTIGAARTMVAESVSKKYHSRAFVLLPLAFNFANILGPIFGGLLAEPVTSLPGFFGPNSVFGGATGVGWMKAFPFAAPNLLSATVLFAEATLVYFGLFETLESRKGLGDSGVEFATTVKNLILGRRNVSNLSDYQQVGQVIPAPGTLEVVHGETKLVAKCLQQPVLPFRRIWTSNVVLTMLSVGLFQFHMGAFSSLWLIFLSTKRDEGSPSQVKGHSPFAFSGGLSFAPQSVGFAMAILGVIGVTLQLFLYPRVNARLGLLRSFRYALVLFPVAYFLAPYLALIPSATAHGQASGVALWSGIAIVLGLEVSAQTFAIPASIILMTNSTPHPSVLGTINGLGQCAAAISKTMGTMLAGRWYAIGLQIGVVGTAWWAVAGVSVLGCFAAYFIYNGSGHEIRLPGDKETDANEL